MSWSTSRRGVMLRMTIEALVSAARLVARLGDAGDLESAADVDAVAARAAVPMWRAGESRQKSG